MTRFGALLKRLARWGALGLAAGALIVGPAPPAGASIPSSAVWIYLRGGQPPAANEPVVSVLAVGDVMLGRGLAGTPDVFAHVADTLQSADLTMGNLEGVITSAPPDPQGLALLMPPGTEAALAGAGFDLLGLANNHSLDAGPGGLAETQRRLSAAGLDPVDGLTPVVRQVGGLKLAFLAWSDLGAAGSGAAAGGGEPWPEGRRTPWWSWCTGGRSTPAIRSCASASWPAGCWPPAPTWSSARTRMWPKTSRSTRASASGDRARLVAYSLGNFAFDQGWDDTAQGLALRLLFDQDGLRAAQVLPLWTAPRPRWMDPGDASDLLARVLPPERVGFACSADICRPVPVPDDSQSGVFTSGSVDLTGDGVPETVRLQGGAAEILHDGQTVWRSPPNWTVRDLALGDPNLDGRYELLLAVDAAGRGSQPIVLGYRGGLYRQLWGGSPVADPILEVELADLDGDGGQEMVTLESVDGGATRDLAVWRWHGWGFSLVWRSPPGDYHDLVVLPAADGQPARLSVGTR